MATTMVQLKKDTARRLQDLKKYPRETYDEVINSLIDTQEEEPITEQELKEIEEGLEDIRKGRIHRIEDVAKELKVKL